MRSVNSDARIAEILLLLHAEVTKDGLWVPLPTYLHLYQGETAEAIYKRRQKGHWLDDVECRFPKGGDLWINLIAVNKWAAKSVSKKASRSEEADSATPSE